MAFLREWGFCSHFKIPANLIQLDTTSTLIAVGQGLGLGMIVLLYFLGFYVSDIAPGARGSGPIESRLYSGCMVLFCCFYILLVSGCAMSSILVLLAIVALLILILLVIESVWVWRKFKITKGWRQRLEEQDKRKHRDALLDFLMRNVGRLVIVAFTVAFLILFESFFVGNITAIYQDDFLVPSDNASSLALKAYSDNASLVVLRVYGDELICAPLNADNRTVAASFFIVKLDDQPRPVLNLEHIGRLKSSGT